MIQSGSLWFSHTVNCEGRAAVQWHQVNLKDGAFLQSGLISDSRNSLIQTTLAVNKNRDVLVGFQEAGPNMFISPRLAYRRADDPPGELRPMLSLGEGKAATEGGAWGDYSGSIIDGDNLLDLWTVQSIADAKGRGDTVIARLASDTNPAPSPVRQTSETRLSSETQPVSAAGESTEVQGARERMLRVVTYNIHHGQARDNKFDYKRLAETIRKLKPDVVALQEVDKGTRRVKGVDQAKKLAAMLGMNHAFGNALHFAGGQYGEAVLSRFPIKKANAHHLPFPFGAEPRTALAVHVVPDNGLPQFILVGTHLCHQNGETRLDQTRQLDRLFSKSRGLPSHLGGGLERSPR